MMRFSPALCTWYEPARIRPPCFAQPKLNGLRAVYKDGHLYSRSGNRWPAPVLAHILEPLRKACGTEVILDGELYRHGWTLDRIAAAASLFRREPGQDTLELGFYVFDLVAKESFGERCSAYCKLIQRAGTYVRPVPAIPIDHASAADAVHAWYLRAGFEGTIYRTGEAGYRSGRNTCLMKRKETRGSGFTAKREFRARVDRWGA